MYEASLLNEVIISRDLTKIANNGRNVNDEVRFLAEPSKLMQGKLK
jgi:hypothetical protein